MPDADPPRAREQRFVFGEVAEQYDAARPSYPDALYDAVMAFGGLSPGDRALELGAGTGKGTAGFVARGLDVLAIEPVPEMAAVLRRKGVRVEVTTFEDWTIEPGAFRLVYGAQSWHWVGGDDRCARGAAALAPGGTVALFWNRGRDHPEPFRTDNDAAYERLWPAGLTHTHWSPGWIVDEFDATGLFEPMIERTFTWECTYTSEEWIRLLQTHSDHRMLDDTVRAELHREVAAAIDAHGGVLPVIYDTVAYLTRRV